MPKKKLDKAQTERLPVAYDDPWVDYTQPKPPSRWQRFKWNATPYWQYVTTIALGMALAGMMVTCFSTCLDYSIAMYQAHKWTQWQAQEDEKADQFDKAHPGQKPMLKGYPHDDLNDL